MQAGYENGHAPPSLYNLDNGSTPEDLGKLHFALPWVTRAREVDQASKRCSFLCIFR